MKKTQFYLQNKTVKKAAESLEQKEATHPPAKRQAWTRNDALWTNAQTTTQRSNTLHTSSMKENDSFSNNPGGKKNPVFFPPHLVDQSVL